MVWLGPVGECDPATGRAPLPPGYVYAPHDVTVAGALAFRRGDPMPSSYLALAARPYPPSPPRRGVSLGEARRRVGRTMGVDAENWYWTADEVRWLAAEWRRAGAGRLPAPPPPRAAAAWGVRLIGLAALAHMLLFLAAFLKAWGVWWG
jgi:hypothetical protein